MLPVFEPSPDEGDFIALDLNGSIFDRSAGSKTCFYFFGDTTQPFHAIGVETRDDGNRLTHSFFYSNFSCR